MISDAPQVTSPIKRDINHHLSMDKKWAYSIITGVNFFFSYVGTVYLFGRMMAQAVSVILLTIFLEINWAIGELMLLLVILSYYLLFVLYFFVICSLPPAETINLSWKVHLDVDPSCRLLFYFCIVGHVIYCDFEIVDICVMISSKPLWIILRTMKSFT